MSDNFRRIYETAKEGWGFTSLSQCKQNTSPYAHQSTNKVPGEDNHNRKGSARVIEQEVDLENLIDLGSVDRDDESNRSGVLQVAGIDL
jgi:hypothetical protein